MPNTEPYELIYYGTGPDPYVDTWPDQRDGCLHATSHAQHPLWNRAPHRAMSAAEANTGNYGRCKSCLAAEGELP
jgi:hypothetical protein